LTPWALAAAALIAALALVATAWWRGRRLARALERLADGAADLAAGKTSQVEIPEEADVLAGLALSLNRLASTAAEQYAAVRKERDHLQAILSSMSEGVLVVGRDGRARLANPAFARLFDLSHEPAGRPVLEVVRLPELARMVAETLETAQAQAAQIELLSPERRTLELASSALSAGSGGEGGAVVMARDLTELVRVDAMRRDFVANVSHELKTPLAAIRGYAETLRDGALTEPPTAQRFTERILSQCIRLEALLDDLLTLSRLEAVAPSAERERVDLAALVQRAADLVGALAREKEVSLTVEVEPVPEVLGDADSLERLVLNLLDNAIKYNRPQGRVLLRLQGAGDAAVVEVSDTGIGIPQESIPRIFERFYRVDKGRARDEGGTGLGLAIVKHVAQAHGGQVDVESRAGQGTTFRVRLPLEGAAQAGS
jgi:two-component system phosphate regulon sensor histidine kinase PhoR